MSIAVIATLYLNVESVLGKSQFPLFSNLVGYQSDRARVVGANAMRRARS
jgi:hypothetical protein